MPVRSYNLKLVVPRGDDALSLRAALWTTHAEVNAATRYYEERLLLMRAAAYEIASADDASGRRLVTLAEAEAASLAMARDAQRANRARTQTASDLPGTDAEVLAALRALYGLLAPDETGEGSAQAANGYLSPLTDPASRGFASAAEKLERPRPNWLSMDDDDPALLDAANAWLASDASLPWRSDTGSPPAWRRAARVGKPNWPALFRAKIAELGERSVGGPEATVAHLRSLMLLPLFPPYFAPRMAEPGGAVTPWDRLAFRLAVAHVLSWEAWCRRAVEQYASRKARLDEYRARAVTADIEPLLGRVRDYERQRSEELSRLGLGLASYDLRRRQLLGWPDLRDAWRKAKTKTAEALRAVAAEHQTKLRGRFGDPHVFAWLAEHAQHALWSGEADVVTVATTLNEMRALLDRSRESATMTLPDPQRHPRATQWSAEGDSNLRPYRLAMDAKGMLSARLSLLRRQDDGRLVDADATFRLAASSQIRVQRIGRRGKKAELAFITGAGDTHTAEVGSADLLFDRAHAIARTPAALAAGQIGPVWLKLSLDLDAELPAGWAKDHARFARHFSAALGKPSKVEDAVRDGARVLSVDLGLRTFAACSVFMLRAERPVRDGALAFTVPIGARTLWASHERSFHLALPGEDASREGVTWRRTQEEELRRLRRALSRYRRVMRLTGLPAAERPAAVAAHAEALAEADPFPFEAAIRAALGAQVATPQPVWDEAVAAALRDVRRGMNLVIRDWRRQGKERLDFRRAGKSMWAIEHLTGVRRLLLSWSLLGRTSGEVRRLSRAERGVFASHLLEHVGGMKEDRLKTGADLIVRAALGHVRDQAGRWQGRFAPCDVVLFEDLSRYRMRTDRPRRENSQLMRWAHRGVPAEVAMQGALHGLEVAETSAAFSSRYHARTLTPGIRCRPLAERDLEDEWLREDLAALGIDLAACRPGDLVPREGGQVFACLRPGEGLLRLDADINAAQNLQRRFWTRHAEAFRLPCLPAQLDGQAAWVPKALGKRLLGALGGAGVLRPTGHDTGSCRWEPVRGRQARALAGMAAEAEGPAADPDQEELSGLLDEAEMEAGRVEVFFRDPSGVVLPAGLWFPSKTFWGIVRRRTVAALRGGLGGAEGIRYDVEAGLQGRR